MIWNSWLGFEFQWLNSCYHELFHNNRNKLKSVENLSMDLWHLIDMKIILFKFAEDDCLNTKLCSLYLFFFVLILSIWFTIKPNNLKYSSQISEKHDQTSIFAEGVLWNQSCSSVHLSVCLSVCLSVSLSVTHFSQDLTSGYS